MTIQMHAKRLEKLALHFHLISVIRAFWNTTVSRQAHQTSSVPILTPPYPCHPAANACKSSQHSNSGTSSSYACRLLWSRTSIATVELWQPRNLPAGADMVGLSRVVGEGKRPCEVHPAKSPNGAFDHGFGMPSRLTFWNYNPTFDPCDVNYRPWPTSQTTLGVVVVEPEVEPQPWAKNERASDGPLSDRYMTCPPQRSRLNRL